MVVSVVFSGKAPTALALCRYLHKGPDLWVSYVEVSRGVWCRNGTDVTDAFRSGEECR